MIKRNDRQLGVNNGDRARVIAVEPDNGAIVVQRRDEQIRLDDRFLAEPTMAGDPPLAYGYAITGHVAQGLTVDHALVLADDGIDREWAYVAAYQSWRRRAFRRALKAAGVEHTTPYALRHSFASLLLHEGRSVIYVARQLGHDARLTLSRYGHVIDELDEQPRIDAETAIQEARVPSQFPATRENDPTPDSRTPETRVEAANSGRWS